MNRLTFFLLIFFLKINLIFAENFSEKAKQLFLKKQFVASQSEIKIEIKSGNVNDELEYLYAKCSKELFLNDAISLYNVFLQKYPYSRYIDSVYYDLGQIYFREKKYNSALRNFNMINDNFKSNEINFKVGYSFFCIDSLNLASYYFLKLINNNNKYQTASIYYYACIAYKKEMLSEALSYFERLHDSKVFKSIVPYYISQIYFSQNEFKKLINYLSPIIDNVIPSRSAEMNRILAEAYYHVNDHVNAVKFFNIYLKNEDRNSSAVFYMLANSYYKINDFENAINQLIKIKIESDSISQYAVYLLGASYLKNNNYNYALQAFKKASTFEFDKKLQEDALYNYSKLSFQLDLPYDNTLEILNNFLISFNHSSHKEEIKNLMIKVLQGTSKYEEAYASLSDINSPSFEQLKMLEQLSFFLGVKSYNALDYKKAINFFREAVEYQINYDYYYLSSFWLADCYYHLSNYTLSAELYNDLPLNNNKSLQYYDALHKYNLGYCYFKQKDFNKSIKYFRSFEKLSKDSLYLNDTYLRLADGYFMNSNYLLAEKYYDKVANYNMFDVDYALYNRSVCMGLLNKNKSKLELLKIIENDTSSRYYENAIFDIAEYYKNLNKYTLSVKYYNNILKYSKNSKLLPEARLNIGLIYFNENKVNKAIKEFKYIVKNYRNSTVFKEALAGLQIAYSSSANIDLYLSFIDSIPQYNISVSEQDSLIYNTAFIKFSEGDYYTANTTFNKYIDKFPNGFFIADAVYYNSISALNVGDTAMAIDLFNQIIDLDMKDYLEPALTFLSRTYYKRKDFTKSNNYYKSLLDESSNNFINRESLIRLMFGYEGIDSSLAYNYANKVILLDKIDDWLLSKAYIIIARSEFKSGNYAKSKNIFEKVEKLSEYDEGAEAKYFLSFITYLDDSLVLAEKMIFELVDKYSNDKFIAKAFLLLSDIYLIQGNNFQAKATLESIIDNHEGKEIVEIARKKWEKIIESEIKINNVVDEISLIDISYDEIDYDMYDNSSTLIDTNYRVPYLDSLTNKEDLIDKNLTDE